MHIRQTLRKSLSLMRELISPLNGIRSFAPSQGGVADGGAAAISLLGFEYIGFTLDFLAYGYALRTLDANDLIGAEPQGFALEFISNTSAMKVS